MKFNMFNWILETLSLSLVFIFSSRILTILYVITLSCGTPLVYFLGIEENRSKIRDYFIANIRTFSKKNKKKGYDSKNQTALKGSITKRYFMTKVSIITH